MKEIEKDELAINTIRFLSLDMIEKADSGHPGMPLGFSPVIFIIFKYFLRFDPDKPNWRFRDIFILSSGHASAMLYSTLHLFGYKITIDDLKNFRQLNSLTPGHPEYNHTPGVEVTTGPLGQGVATSVGFAFSRKYMSEIFDKEDISIFKENKIFVILGDGDIMEGITYEAASLAGKMKLSNLIWIYDSNSITIEGSTSLAFDEDIQKRFEATGWNFIEGGETENIESIKQAIKRAIDSSVYGKPTFIRFKSIIGYGSPKAGTNKVHGEPLKPQEADITRENLGWKFKERFFIPYEVKKHMEEIIKLKKLAREEFDKKIKEYSSKYPHLYSKLNEFLNQDFNHNFNTTTEEKEMATRDAFSIVLNRCAELNEKIITGSADLAPSTKAIIKNDDKRVIHFGVREHAMAAFCNGLSNDGYLRPICSTFLVFSDYLRPALRLSALMSNSVIYVFTHDSIGVGQDGPTHQPIEHLMSLRLIPNLAVIRPADFYETQQALKTALKLKKPAVIALSRQKLKVLHEFKDIIETNFSNGIYHLLEKEKADAIIFASGSEVQIALEVSEMLNKNGIIVDVASAPCLELFKEKEKSYKEKFLKYKYRFLIEASNTMGWANDTIPITMAFDIKDFGRSAKEKDLYNFFGLTANKISNKIKEILTINFL